MSRLQWTKISFFFVLVDMKKFFINDELWHFLFRSVNAVVTKDVKTEKA